MSRLTLALLIGVSAFAQSDPWAVLRPLEGKWEGPSWGQPGKGVATREYHFEMNGRYFAQHDRAVYEPKSAAVKPEIHEDMGFFSYDRNQKKLVWRQFHSEGYVNEYVLESASADGRTLDFVTVRIENIAPGWRAKESFHFLESGELENVFWLAEPGKDFEVYAQSRLKRSK